MIVHLRGLCSATLVALVGAMDVACAQDKVEDTAGAAYYVDDSSCSADNGSGTVSGSWNGRHWTLVAPAAIDTSEVWRRKYGTGLHIRPLSVFREESAMQGAFIEDAADSSLDENIVSDGEARIRLVLAQHTTVAQEFSGPYRLVRVVVRLCVKRGGAWQSIVFGTVRGVVGKKEFWRAQPDSVREQDFVKAFHIAVRSALTWASQTVDKPWTPGTMVKDSIYGVQGEGN